MHLALWFLSLFLMCVGVKHSVKRHHRMCALHRLRDLAHVLQSLAGARLWLVGIAMNDPEIRTRLYEENGESFVD